MFSWCDTLGFSRRRDPLRYAGQPAFLDALDIELPCACGRSHRALWDGARPSDVVSVPNDTHLQARAREDTARESRRRRIQ